MVEPEAKAIAPNIALLKWCRWCEINGHEYRYIRGLKKIDYEADHILMSCIFTKYHKEYKKTIQFYLGRYPNAEMTVGGVFPSLNPEWFKELNDVLCFDRKIIVHIGTHPDIENLTPKYNVKIESVKQLPYTLDNIVTYASRGCVNKCGYCAVPRLEGKMRSFKTIRPTLEAGVAEIENPNAVVLYDNNFTEHEYLEDIVDELVEFDIPVDIHGLHVESFNDRVAEQFTRLKWGSQSGRSNPSYLRFSFDKKSYAPAIQDAYKLFLKHKIKSDFFLYMLYNYKDSPDDFFWRIQSIQNIVDRQGGRMYMYPQRYIPLDSREKYIVSKWNREQLKGLKILTNRSRGFLTAGPDEYLYNWVGRTKQEFNTQLYKWATDGFASKKGED